MKSKRPRPDGDPSPGSPSRPAASVRRAADVSRETIPAAIARQTREIVARWLSQNAFCPDAAFLDRIESMAATLALWGQTTNLTANPTDPAELAFHVIDSLAPAVFASGAARADLDRIFASDRAVLDLGSGAGFPGLVLAAAFESRFTLAEARRKRASYLQVAANEMALGNVTIERQRLSIENVAIGFDLVTARAFAAGDEMHALAAASLRPGGLMLLYASEAQARARSHALEAAFEGPDTWNYRLPHGDRVVERAAILWRRKLDDS